MVLFDSGSAKMVSSPSDKVERAVPNALTAYESRTATSDKHYIVATAPESVLFEGSEYILDVQLKNAAGETVEHEYNASNTKVYIEDDFGIIDFVDGDIMFVAGGGDR